MKKLFFVLILISFSIPSFSFTVTNAKAGFGVNSGTIEYPKSDDVTNFFAHCFIQSDLGFFIQSRLGYLPFMDFDKKSLGQRFSNKIGFDNSFKLSEIFYLPYFATSEYNYYYKDSSESYLEEKAAAGIGLRLKGFIEKLDLYAGVFGEQWGSYTHYNFFSQLSFLTEPFYFSKEAYYQVLINSFLKSMIQPVKNYNYYQLEGEADIQICVEKNFFLFAGFRLKHFINGYQEDLNPETGKILGIKAASPNADYIVRFMEKEIFVQDKKFKEYFIEFEITVKIR